MKRKSVQFLIREYGLQEYPEKNFAGRIHSFYTIVTSYDSLKQFMIRINAFKEDESPEIYLFLQGLNEYKQVNSVDYDGSQIIIMGNLGLSWKNLNNTLGDCLDQTIEFLENNGYQTGCMVTHQLDETIRLAKINDLYEYMSDEGYQQVVATLETDKEEIHQMEENIPLGIIGALLGALVGGVLWVLISKAGYYAWLAGFLAIYMAFFGYRKLSGGKVGKLGSLLVFVVVIAVLATANLVEWGWHFYDYFKGAYDVTFIEVLKETPYLLKSDSELMGGFIKDLLIGVGLVVAGGIPTIIGMYKESSGSFKVIRNVQPKKIG